MEAVTGGRCDPPRGSGGCCSSEVAQSALSFSACVGRTAEEDGSLELGCRRGQTWACIPAPARTSPANVDRFSSLIYRGGGGARVLTVTELPSAQGARALGRHTGLGVGVP